MMCTRPFHPASVPLPQPTFHDMFLYMLQLADLLDPDNDPFITSPELDQYVGHPRRVVLHR